MEKLNPSELSIIHESQEKLIRLFDNGNRVPIDEWVKSLALSYYLHNSIDQHFTTPTILFPHIGACYASFAESELWDKNAATFDVFEVGGGKGLMCLSFLNEAKKLHPNFYDAVKYHIVEVSEKQIQEQQILIDKNNQRSKVTWHHENIQTFEFPYIDNGLVNLMELIDTLPTKALVKISHSDALELFLIRDSKGDIHEFLDEPSDEIKNVIRNYPEWWGKVPIGDDYLYPVCIPTIKLYENIFNKTHNTGIITVDYGFKDPLNYPFQYPFDPPFKMIYKHNQLKLNSLNLHRAPIAEMFHHAGVADVSCSVDFQLLACISNKHHDVSHQFDRLGAWIDRFGGKSFSQRHKDFPENGTVLIHKSK